MTAETGSAATERIATVMNHGWLCMLLSMGERLRLHEALAQHGPLTAAGLAELTGCDERYLREWLWGMVAGDILTASDDDEPAFDLPAEYVPVLTASGGPLHWSRITTQITALATLEDALADAFRTGGGLSADHYEGRMAEVFAGESGPIFERVLLDEILPLSGRMADLEAGIDVADLGCGTGAAAILIARRFPRSRVVGVDQSRSALETARAHAEALGLTNVVFREADLEDELDLAPQDLIMAANAVHDLADPEAFFRRVRAALAPGGTLYLHELGAVADMRVNVRDPHALGILTFGIYHCLPLAKRRAVDVPGGMWGRERFVDALHAAGFTDVRVHNSPSDPNNDTIFAV